jgi:hypothetical protein
MRSGVALTAIDAREGHMAENVTKVDAVGQALAELGPDASRSDIQGWVKDKYGYEMSQDHISDCKKTLARRAGSKNGRPKQAALKPEAKNEPATPQNAVPSGGEKISKKEAVRRSLGKLGKKAQPADIQKDIKDRFGIDMTTNHISTTKGELRRAKKKPGAKKAARR